MLSCPGRNRVAAVVLVVLGGACLVSDFGLAQDGPAGGRLEKPRVAPLEESQWSEAQRAILAPRAERGPVLNIYRTLAQHPALYEAWIGFAGYVFANSTLPPRQREMAMLRIGWLCRSDYEFGQHARIAKGLGMTDAEILAITKGPDDASWGAFERALLRAVDELHAEAFVSDATWTELRKEYSEQQMMDLIFTVGQYNLVSMALNSLGVEREAGLAGFPEGAGE
jgi:alkylhydroperoxidase family enzyme